MARGNGATNTPVNDDIAVERELPCKLTDDELRMRGDAMAEAELVVDLLKNERRTLNKKILAHVDTRNRLAHVIDSETEPRPVVCKWIASFDENVYRLVRQDTGDVIESRPMSAADRQGSLPIPTDGDGDGDDGADMPERFYVVVDDGDMSDDAVAAEGGPADADVVDADLNPAPKKRKPATNKANGKRSRATRSPSTHPPARPRRSTKKSRA